MNRRQLITLVLLLTILSGCRAGSTQPQAVSTKGTLDKNAISLSGFTIHVLGHRAEPSVLRQGYQLVAIDLALENSGRSPLEVAVARSWNVKLVDKDGYERDGKLAEYPQGAVVLPGFWIRLRTMFKQPQAISYQGKLRLENKTIDLANLPQISDYKPITNPDLPEGVPFEVTFAKDRRARVERLDVARLERSEKGSSLIGRLEATIENLYGYDQPIADLFAISLLGYDAGGGFFAGKVGVPVCKVAMQSNVLAPGASATCSADFQLQGELPILVEAHRGSLLLAVKWSGRTEEGRWQLQRFQNPVVSVAMDVGSGDRWGSIAFSPDGTTIAIAPCGPVQLRRVSDGSLVRILNAPNTMWGLGSEASVAFSRDGALLASGACLENTDYLWSVSSGTLLQTFGEGERSTVSAERRWVAFNPDGKSYLSVSYEGMVRTRQVSDGTLLNEWPMRDPYSYPYEVAFSNDGMMLASWGWRTRYNGETKPLVLWKASEGTVLRVLGGHGNEWVGNAAFSPDGKMLASVGGDDTLKFWQISDGTLLRAIGLPNGGQSAVAFSPHGEIVVTASGGGTSGSSISLWRVSDGTLLRTLKSRSKWIFDLEFSPDGSVLAFAASDEARLWWLPELDPK